MAEAAETELGNFDDGMSEAERHYFQSGGDVNETLAREAATPPEPPAPTIDPAAPPAGQEPPVGAAPAPGADDDDDEPAAAPAPGAAPGAEQGQPRRVSYKKFQAAEDARQRAERELNEQRVRQARVEERLSLLQQAMQPEPQQQVEQEDPEPDPEQDIFAYVRWQQRQIAAAQNKISTYEQQIVQGQAEMDGERRYIESLNSYAGTQQDFGQAYQYLLQVRQLELLQSSGVNITVDEETGQLNIPPVPAEVRARVNQQLRQEEKSLYTNAFEREVNPGQEIYRLAQLRGYRRPKAPAPNGNGAAAPTNGARAPVGTPLGQQPGQAAPAAQPRTNGQAAPAAAAPTATEIVASLKRGQAAAQSLSNAGGTSIGLAQLTPEMLASMSDDEFAAVYNSLSLERQKELMGN